MERALNIEMQKGMQRAGAAATRAEQMSREIDWAARIKGIFRRRKSIDDRQAAKDRRHRNTGNGSMFHEPCGASIPVFFHWAIREKWC